MKTSQDGILTTHVGTLPCPEALLQLLIAQQRGACPGPDQPACTSQTKKLYLSFQ